MIFNLLYVYFVDIVLCGVEWINEWGIVYDGCEYLFDVFIYVIGFCWMVIFIFNMVVGCGGCFFSEKWESEGMCMFFGIYS